MKAIELLLNQEIIIPEELNSSKRIKTLASSLMNLMQEMQNQINKVNEFTASQLDGELSSKIIVAKSLAQFFSGNKYLKVDLAVESLRAEEKSVINNYYNIKTQLLDTLRAILKESNKEAVVSAFDVYGNEFQKCDSGHEILILEGRNTNVLESLIKDLDESLIIEGNIDKIVGQEVDYDLATLSRNIDLCNRKNTEVNGSKPGKMAKAESVITKLKEVGSQVVAFYTYKEALLDIGVSPKGIKDYENELSKAYIPLKKALQKEFKIELEDICDIKVDEDQYDEVTIEESQTAYEATSNTDNNQTILENNQTTEENTFASEFTVEQPTQFSSFESANHNVEEQSTSNPFESASSNETPLDNTNTSAPTSDSNPFTNPFETFSSSNPFADDDDSSKF